MNKVLRFFVALAALSVTSAARADDATTCGDAFDQSQTKRDDGKLLEARRLLRICGGSTCSPTQQRHCAEWLADVDARLPSFVLSAKDGSGADRVDVKVVMDDVPVADKLDGRAIDVDPGQHAFVFELADGTRVQTTAVANERAQGKSVAVTFPGRSPAPQGGAPASTRSGQKTVALVAGCAGIVGIGLGSIFGAMAFPQWHNALRECTTNCAPGSQAQNDKNSASTSATISDIGFVAGGVLLAGAAVLWFTAPSGAEVQVAPTASPQGAGFTLRGTF